MATSLNARVGPWNSSSTHRAAVDLHQRRDGRMPEARIGVARERDQLAAREAPPTNGSSTADRHLGERLARRAPAMVSGRNVRPGLRHVEAAIARETCQQGLLEGELRRFASGADISHGSGTHWVAWKGCPGTLGRGAKA